MTPHSRTALGLRRRTTITGGTITYTDTVTPSRRFSLSCPTTVVQGDHKSPNAFNFSISDYTVPHGSASMSGSGWLVAETGDSLLGEQDTLPYTYYTELRYPYNKALEKLYSRVRSDVDLSIDLAEIAQTRRMISGACGDMLRLATSWKRGVAGISKEISSAWLQWQYGVKPLMGTIHDLCSKQIDHCYMPKTFKARASNRDRGTVSNLQYTSYGIPSTVKWESSTRTELSVSLSVSSANLNTLSQFTSLNPVSIAWELTPYSFVADWFVDVGGYLRLAETALLSGLQFHSGYRTNSWRVNYERTTKGRKRRYGTTYRFDTSCSYEQKGMNRVILTSMPFPELPRFEPKLGSERLFSAASLLRQLL